jgi:hypothetical protein
MLNSIGQKLEQYTLKHPQQVLIVTVEREETTDQVIIYKGFSSSLTGQTAFDPDIPIIPPEAKIISIDILEGPYQPNAPRYLQQGITWEEMEQKI